MPNKSIYIRNDQTQGWEDLHKMASARGLTGITEYILWLVSLDMKQNKDKFAAVQKAQDHCEAARVKLISTGVII